MKYYVKQTIEDKTAFEGINNFLQFSYFAKVSQPYIHNIVNGKITLTQKQYEKYKKLVEEYKKKQTSNTTY